MTRDQRREEAAWLARLREDREARERQDEADRWRRQPTGEVRMKRYKVRTEVLVTLAVEVRADTPEAASEEARRQVLQRWALTSAVDGVEVEDWDVWPGTDDVQEVDRG